MVQKLFSGNPKFHIGFSRWLRERLAAVSHLDDLHREHVATLNLSSLGEVSVICMVALDGEITPKGQEVGPPNEKGEKEKKTSFRVQKTLPGTVHLVPCQVCWVLSSCPHSELATPVYLTLKSKLVEGKRQQRFNQAEPKQQQLAVWRTFMDRMSETETKVSM